MAPIYSAEWNATCGQRPASTRITAEVGAPYMGFSWFINILTAIVVPVGLAMFLYGRTQWPYIRKRNLPAIICCACGVVLSAIAGPVRDVVGREKFPCDLAMWSRIFAGKLIREDFPHIY